MHGSATTLDWRRSEPRFTYIIISGSKRLIGSSEIEQIWQLSWRTSFYRGGPVFMSAMAGLDIALWDLKGMTFLYISIEAKAADDGNLQLGSSECQYISSWVGKLETSSRSTLG